MILTLTTMENKIQKLSLNLSIDEINIILEGLSQLPYMKVYKLIEQIHLQAGAQTQSVNGDQVPPGK
jgi:hypothetical protein